MGEGSVVIEPIYEYIEFWGEESGAISSNQFEYSAGNGATGGIGRPINGAGWEIIEMAFQADVYDANAQVQVDILDIQSVVNNTAPVISPCL